MVFGGTFILTLQKIRLIRLGINFGPLVYYSPGTGSAVIVRHESLRKKLILPGINVKTGQILVIIAFCVAVLLRLSFRAASARAREDRFISVF